MDDSFSTIHELQRRDMDMKELFGDVIYSYTMEQAEEDGILVNISQVRPEWMKGPFSHVTRNLLNQGYLNDEDGVNLPNVLDLMNQSLEIMKRETKNYKEMDSFLSGEIELPSGEKQKIFIQLNEKGKYTIMLPEDY